MLLWYSQVAIAVEEISYGIWTFAALILLTVVVCYIMRVRRESPDNWLIDPGVGFGIALATLMAGHVLRSGLNWVKFWEIDGAFPYLSVLYWFPLAILLALTGKVLIIRQMVIPERRWIAITSVLVIPPLISVLIYMLR